MSRPNTRTPIAQLIAILNALVPWCDAHHETLTRALPGEDLRGEVCAALAARVQDSEALVIGEQIDDRDVSASAVALFGEVRRFLKSTDAAVQLALRHDARWAQVRDDMFVFAPSDVRSARRAREALLHLIRGLEARREQLTTPHTDPERRIAQAQGLLAQLAQHEVHKSTEGAETQRAYKARDQARDDALQHIATLHLAARALEFDHPAPFEELTRLYAAHSPAPRRRASGGDDDAALDFDGDDE